MADGSHEEIAAAAAAAGQPRDNPSPAATRESVLAVTTGFLGWTLDAFDFFLVAIALPAIATDLKVTEVEIAFSLTLTLIFRPVGAFIFGLLADRYGRRIPMMIDLVFYSAVEVATAFAPNLTHLPGAAGVVRHRHGRRVGPGDFAGDGESARQVARRC